MARNQGESHGVDSRTVSRRLDRNHELVVMSLYDVNRFVDFLAGTKLLFAQRGAQPLELIATDVGDTGIRVSHSS